jgi:hypothetical protein
VVAALADGRVVSASYDGPLRVWDLTGGELFAIFARDALPHTLAIEASGVAIAGDESRPM